MGSLLEEINSLIISRIPKEVNDTNLTLKGNQGSLSLKSNQTNNYSLFSNLIELEDINYLEIENQKPNLLKGSDLATNKVSDNKPTSIGNSNQTDRSMPFKAEILKKIVRKINVEDLANFESQENPNRSKSKENSDIESGY